MAAKTIYQFKITLKGIRPPIWRRFQIHSDITFYELHRAVQTMMGWYDGHLHLFDLGGMLVTDAETLAEGWDDGVDERHARLPKYVRQEGQKIRYEYDFGDGWEHELSLEKILPAEPAVFYPRCLKGKRACPPEDCGGLGGYYDLWKILKNPKHKEYRDMLEWLGLENANEFKPETFVINSVSFRNPTKALQKFEKEVMI